MQITLNPILDRYSSTLDRGYLSNESLAQLELYIQTFPNRINSYKLLRDQTEEIVTRSLELLEVDYPELVKTRKQLCRRDMTIVLTSMALAILRDDERLFREQLLDWFSNILSCFQVNDEYSLAYKKVQLVVDRLLPQESALSIKHYTSITIEALTKKE